MDPYRSRPREGRALGRHRSRERPELCRNRRRFRIGRRSHAFRACKGHRLPSPAGMIYRFATTGSTMNDAAALAKQGEPHGTAVVAEEQTEGIGRHGHSWHSEPGAGLYLSIILRLPPIPTLTMA